MKRIFSFPLTMPENFAKGNGRDELRSMAICTGLKNHPEYVSSKFGWVPDPFFVGGREVGAIWYGNNPIL